MKPGPVWRNRVSVVAESLATSRFLVLAHRAEGLVIVRSLHVASPSGELADKELLAKACANAFSRANRKISED
jgi:hypothetical protein